MGERCEVDVWVDRQEARLDLAGTLLDREKQTWVSCSYF